MTKTLAFVLSASLAACAGQAEVRYAGNASNPELVELDGDPSVLVVSNADEPVFFSENTYWLFRDQHWYRSQSSRGGWAAVDQPPEHLRRIHQPIAYVHYRGSASAPRTTLNDRAPGASERAPDRADPRADQTPAQRPLNQTPEGPAPAPTRSTLTPEQQQAQRHDQLEPTRDGHEATQPRPAEPERQATPRPEPVRKDDDTVNRPDRPGLVPRSQQATPSDARRAPDVSQTQLPDMRDDKPAHQVAPDPERAPISPGQPVPQSNFELPDDIRALRPDARAERMIAPPESDPQQRQPDSY